MKTNLERKPGGLEFLFACLGFLIFFVGLGLIHPGLMLVVFGGAMFSFFCGVLNDINDHNKKVDDAIENEKQKGRL